MSRDRIRIADPAAIDEAAALLRDCALVAFPTETVFGLGADAQCDEAVARIFAAKGRPAFNPLIVHVADWATARQVGALPAPLLRAAEAFWPGPLTIVTALVPGAPVCQRATAGLSTVALRWPSHAVAQSLIRAAGVPVVAPSANRSGYVSAVTAAHVAEDLGDRVAMILDDRQPSPVGVESTIVTLDPAREGALIILRPGAVTAEALAARTGFGVINSCTANTAAPRREGPQPSQPMAPGQLESHYAPGAEVRLEVLAPAADEVLLWLGPAPAPAGAAATLVLSPEGDLTAAAHQLFVLLREADAMCKAGHSNAQRIAVGPVPNTGLGVAINDRLRRAAAPR